MLVPVAEFFRSQLQELINRRRIEENGLAPWRIATFADSLTIAFREQNREKIICFASNLGRSSPMLMCHCILLKNKQIQDELSQENLYEPLSKNTPELRREFS